MYIGKRSAECPLPAASIWGHGQLPQGWGRGGVNWLLGDMEVDGNGANILKEASSSSAEGWILCPPPLSMLRSGTASSCTGLVHVRMYSCSAVF